MTQALQLKDCEPCAGRGFVRGIFHRFECDTCRGVGRVQKDTGAPLGPEAIALVERERQGLALSGPAQDYVGQRNKHHRGGGNWTGD